MAAAVPVSGVLDAQFCFEHVHGLEEGGPLLGGEPVEDPGQGLGGAVEPLLDEGVFGRCDLHDGPPPVDFVGVPADEACPVEVGQDAADQGEGRDRRSHRDRRRR